MPRFVTADAVAAVPTLAGVPAEDHAQILTDAGEMLAYVAANEWATDHDVRQHFENLDWTPDRFNLAYGTLRDTGKLLVFDDTAAAVFTQEPATSPDDEAPVA